LSHWEKKTPYLLMAPSGARKREGEPKSARCRETRPSGGPPRISLIEPSTSSCVAGTQFSPALASHVRKGPPTAQCRVPPSRPGWLPTPLPFRRPSWRGHPCGYNPGRGRRCFWETHRARVTGVVVRRPRPPLALEICVRQVFDRGADGTSCQMAGDGDGCEWRTTAATCDSGQGEQLPRGGPSRSIHAGPGPRNGAGF